MPSFNILLVATLVAAAGSALAQAGHAIAPGGVHEECVMLMPGKRLKYSFKTETPLDFNIHYHSGNDVSYPVKRDAVKSGADILVARRRQEYCLMWSNPSKQAATVFYRYAVE